MNGNGGCESSRIFGRRERTIKDRFDKNLAHLQKFNKCIMVKDVLIFALIYLDNEFTDQKTGLIDIRGMRDFIRGMTRKGLFASFQNTGEEQQFLEGFHSKLSFRNVEEYNGHPSQEISVKGGEY